MGLRRLARLWSLGKGGFSLNRRKKLTTGSTNFTTFTLLALLRDLEYLISEFNFYFYL